MLRNTSVLLLATLIGGAANATGAELKLFGSITGQVRNTAGTTQMGIDSLIVLAALWVTDWQRLAWSVLGAVVLNLVLAVNHRPGRYMAV